MSSRSNGVTNVEFSRRMTECVMSSLVVLDVAQPAGERRAVGAGLQQLGQQVGTDHEVLAGGGELVVEAGVAGGESEAHGTSSRTAAGGQGADGRRRA